MRRRTRVASSSVSVSTTWSSARARRRRRQRSARRIGNQLLNRLASYLTGRHDSRSHVRISRRAARAPARVPAPAAQRILDADDDDAGVHQGGLQRHLRAGRCARAHRSVEDPIRPGRRAVLSDPPEGHHHLQPAAHLRPDQRGVAAARRRLRSAELRDVGTDSERCRDPDSVRGDRVPRRLDLGADLLAPLRRAIAVVGGRR